jgi:carbonic anhydrase
MRTPSRFTRREFVYLSGVAAVGLAAQAHPLRGAAEEKAPRSPDVIWRELLAGNERFVKGTLEHPRRTPDEFKQLAEGQFPEAVIVGCADSRVPPEILFDQGVGDLFVVRVAGNVVDGAGPILKGSIEYAVAELNVRLIVVLGHSQCGAVKAAIKHIDAKDKVEGSIGRLIESIQPAVTEVRGKDGNLLEKAIQANVTLGVAKLKTLDKVLKNAVDKGEVKVLGATYDLATGKVTEVAKG